MKLGEGGNWNSCVHHSAMFAVGALAAVAWLLSWNVGYAARKEQPLLSSVVASSDLTRQASFHIAGSNRTVGVEGEVTQRKPHLPMSSVAVPLQFSCAAQLRQLDTNGAWAKRGSREIDAFNSSDRCRPLYYCNRYPFFLMSFIRASPRQFSTPEFRVAHSLAAGLKVRLKGHRDSAVLIDIGVNDGEDLANWFSIFSSMVHHFIFVEPQSRYSAQLRNIIQQRESQDSTVNATLVTSAIGRDDEHTLYVIGSGPSAVGVRASNAEPCLDSWRKASPSIEITSVNLTSIRAVLKERRLVDSRIGFLKIDAEGADATILNDSFWLFEEQKVELLVMELNGRAVGSFPVQLAPFELRLRNAGYRTFLLATHPSTQETVLAELPNIGLAQWNADIETLVAIPTKSTLVEDSGFRLVPPGLESALLIDDFIQVLSPQEPCGRKLFSTALVSSCYVGLYRLPFTLRSKTKRKRVKAHVPVSAYLNRKTVNTSSFFY